MNTLIALSGRALSVVALFALLLPAAVQAAIAGVPSGVYKLDKTHGYISFAYSHLGFSTPHVGFDSLDATVTLDVDKPENSTLDATIDVASIDSRVPALDEQLKGPNFFDVASFPTITFRASKIEMISDVAATITGDLTIKGIVKPVILAAILNKAGIHPLLNQPAIGLNAQAKVLRSEWGLARAVPAVGDEITIYISVELIHSPGA